MKDLFAAIEKLTPIEFEKRFEFMTHIEYLIFMNAVCRLNSTLCLRDIKTVCEDFLGEPYDDQWKSDIYGLLTVFEKSQHALDQVQGIK